ncbi:ABC transporter permease [Dactylosporangium sp. AC04546]|uniref:ABC transporter permease n=1 Tax=Dactylosporangium sp. AC04546 TaxID=2862460 RepID=UPI0027147F2F|nr:ABC transporter permease [Dactylosporangium sp. AC04546]WVK78709.1 ABC transporter permease [Dactylosporangium sp. AC04546]
MTDVVAAEWLKLRSVRSTWWVMLAAVAVLLLSLFMVWGGVNAWDNLPADAKERWNDGAPSEQDVLPFAQLCLAVLAVLAVGGEYGSRMIRGTVVAVPRRGRILAAKAVVTGAVALVCGELIVFVTFFADRAIVGDRPIRGHSRPDVADAVPTLLVLGASVLLVAVVAAGIAFTLRSTAGAVGTVVGLLFVLPVLTQFLPAPWDARVSAVLLPSLPAQLADAASRQVLAPWAAGVVALAYLVLALVPGYLVLTRRDA